MKKSKLKACVYDPRKSVITFTSFIIYIALLAPAFASEVCYEIAKKWPNVPHEKGECELVNQTLDKVTKKPADGMMRCKDDNGKIIRETQVKNGELSSLWLYDYQGHKLSFNFSKGKKLHGPATVLATDGKLLCKMNYVDDKVEGAVRGYFSNGELEDLYWFENGKHRNEPRIEYMRAGKLSHLRCPDKSVTPEDRELCGFNGKPVTVKVYDDFEDTVTHVNGRLTELIRFNKSEGRTWRTVYNEPGNTKSYTEEELHKNGKVFRKFTVVDNEKEGKYFEYADIGKLVLEKEYKNGKVLQEKSYYMNGKLKEESVHSSDKKTISQKGYWDNGQLKSTGTFAFKKRNSYGSRWTDTVPVGKAYKYKNNGSLAEEANYNDEGQLDGNYIYISEDGKRIEAVYSKGILTAKKILSANGNIELSEEYYEDGSRK